MINHHHHHDLYHHHHHHQNHNYHHLHHHLFAIFTDSLEPLMNFECITTTTILFNNQSAEENYSIDNGRDSTRRFIIRGNNEKKDGNVENIKSISSHGIDAIEYSNHHDDDDDNNGKHHTSNSSIRGSNIINHNYHNVNHHHHHHHHHHHTQRRTRLGQSISIGQV